MKHLSSIVATILLCLSTRAHDGLLPVGHPEIFVMFLRYHEAMLSNSFQVRQGGKISQGRAETMLANDYGISVAAVKKLQPTHQRLTEQLGGLDLEIARLLTQEKSNAAVDRRKLFVAAEARRRQAILGAREGLYRSIGSGEARSLDRFIEQDFRITVKVRQLK